TVHVRPPSTAPAFAVPEAGRTRIQVLIFQKVPGALLSVLPVPYSGNRSLNSTRNRKKDRVAGGVRQDRHHRHGQRKGARSILEMAGSTRYLKNPSTDRLVSREIYTIASPREIDRQ